jgi:hypothetical protein
MPELGSPDQNSGSFGEPPNPLDEYDGGGPQSAESSESESAGGEDEEEPAQGEPAQETGSRQDTDLSSLEAFAETYRIAETDAGFTPREIMEEMREGEEREPNELDEEILDGLIMEGHYEREFELGATSFRLRTADPNVTHNVVRVLQDTLGEDEPITQAVRGPMLVSQHLSYFRGEQMPGAAPEESFSSTEALKARFRECMEVPTPVLDAIGERVNAFRERVKDATDRSIANF